MRRSQETRGIVVSETKNSSDPFAEFDREPMSYEEVMAERLANRWSCPQLLDHQNLFDGLGVLS